MIPIDPADFGDDTLTMIAAGLLEHIAASGESLRPSRDYGPADPPHSASTSDTHRLRGDFVRDESAGNGGDAVKRTAWIFTLRADYQYASPIALEPAEPDIEIAYGNTALEAYRTTAFYCADPDDLSLMAFVVEREPYLDEEHAE